MYQKALEDGYSSSKDPETPVMTLDLTSAASAFTNMQTTLGKIPGLIGVPLTYIVRHKLKGSNAFNPTSIGDSPTFGRWAASNCPLTIS